MPLMWKPCAPAILPSGGVLVAVTASHQCKGTHKFLHTCPGSRLRACCGLMRSCLRLSRRATASQLLLSGALPCCALSCVSPCLSKYTCTIPPQCDISEKGTINYAHWTQCHLYSLCTSQHAPPMSWVKEGTIEWRCRRRYKERTVRCLDERQVHLIAELARGRAPRGSALSTLAVLLGRLRVIHAIAVCLRQPGIPHVMHIDSACKKTAQSQSNIRKGIPGRRGCPQLDRLCTQQ